MFYRRKAKALAVKTEAKKEKSEELKVYEKYIRSKDFRLIRERVLERDLYRCRACGRDLQEIDLSGKKISLLVHHSSYDHVGCCDLREIDDCLVLCSVCHKAVHSAKSNLQRFKDKSSVVKNILEREERNE